MPAPAGDRVVFEPISEAEFARLDSQSREKEQEGAARARDPLFRVLSAGLWTSVQGAPRFGWGSYGVPPGGAMDLAALAAGNAALGNSPEAAALEMTVSGPELEVSSPAAISLSGAEFSCRVGDAPVAAGEVREVVSGDRLRFGHARAGARGYLCVRGSLAIPAHPAPSRRLERGDLVWGSEKANESAALAHPSPPFAEATAGRPQASPGGRGSTPGEEAAEEALRVVLGPQEDRFPAEAIAAFLEGTYRVSSSSDRRGIRLEGSPIAHRGGAGAAEISPEGTALGAVQVPADGLPIVLGPDRPVTGGYAKVATVIGADWARLAQALPGTPVRFRAVELAEAVAARRGIRL